MPPPATSHPFLPLDSDAGVSPVNRETASAGAEWSEEGDREAAARRFVNHAADIALRQSLGDLCIQATCIKCGIKFLAMSQVDVLCHVDVAL